jgi:tetratricopeptide (TPR) repeat protein
MLRENDLPDPPAGFGDILVLEAPVGQSRRHVLQQWADRAAGQGAASWLLPCDISQAGLWAGVNSLVEQLLPAVERHASELLDAHALELAAVLPETHGQMKEKETLTASAAGEEAVRNYAMDRAYRLPHGLVDLLDGLFARAPFPAAKVLVCDDYDRAGFMVRRFFYELLRRRGQAFGLSLLVAVEPGGGDAVEAQFGGVAPVRRVRMNLPSDPVAPRTPREMTELARELDARVKADMQTMEVHIPELIRLWLGSETPANAYPWQAFALGRYNHAGFYEDALIYADPVLEHLDEIVGVGRYFTRWNLVGSIFGCLIAVGQVERAYRIVKEEALEKISHPVDRARICYTMAMLHVRFLPQRDPARAEAYLREGLAMLEQGNIPAEDLHFLRVFLNNGLALVRHRQGQPSEAVELCKRGFEELSEHMTDDRHRLHRSVLLYNIAQVYTATGEYEKAVEYFGATMKMDPNYSEYYNDRGNVLLKLGRLEEAVEDYRAAIRLSSPYHEVWTNLGQCFRLMGRYEEAVQAFSRALDLDPTVNLARGGRALALEALGRADEALVDYDAALERQPAQPLVLARRGALHYAQGRVAQAAADLDRAVALAPSDAALYRNRALALADLGRPDEAARDLGKYLELVPTAPDRAQAEARIADLHAMLAAA